MELTSTQLDILNSKIPPGFMLEPLDLSEIKRRKSELEQLQLSAKFSVPPEPRCVKQRPGENLQARPSKVQVSEGFRKLFLILSKLKKHPRSQFFLNEGKEQGQNLNLMLIEGRLFRDEYENGEQFAADIRKMFSDAIEGAAPSSDVSLSTREVKIYFEGLMSGNESILLTLRKQQRVEDGSLSPWDRPLRDDEIEELMGKIRSLEHKYLKGIYAIVRGSETVETVEEQQLKREIGRLEVSVARGLEQHVEACLQKSRQLPKPVLNPQPSTDLALPPTLTQTEPVEPKEPVLRIGHLAPINAPIRQGLTGFHQILPRIPR